MSAEYRNRLQMASGEITNRMADNDSWFVTDPRDQMIIEIAKKHHLRPESLVTYHESYGYNIDRFKQAMADEMGIPVEVFDNLD